MSFFEPLFRTTYWQRRPGDRVCYSYWTPPRSDHFVVRQENCRNWISPRSELIAACPTEEAAEAALRLLGDRAR